MVAAYRGNLFDALHFSDWDQLNPKKKAWQDTLLGLAYGGNEPSVHFMRMGGVADNFDDWNGIYQNCLVVEEQFIQEDNIKAYMNYFVSNSDLAVTLNQVAASGFIESFQADIGRGSMSINDLVNRLDLHILTCIDPVTGAIDGGLLAREDNDYQPLSLRSELRRFLERGDTRDLVRLVSVCARKTYQERWSAIRLLQELYKATLALFPDEGAVSASPKAVAARGVWLRKLVLWSVTLVSWETRLTRHHMAAQESFMRAPDVKIVALDQLCRAYLERTSRDRAGENCLSDEWDFINAAFARAVTRSAARYPPRVTTLVRRIRSSAEAVQQARWIKELLASATAAVSAMPEPQQVQASIGAKLK